LETESFLACSATRSSRGNSLRNARTREVIKDRLMETIPLPRAEMRDQAVEFVRFATQYNRFCSTIKTTDPGEWQTGIPAGRPGFS